MNIREIQTASPPDLQALWDIEKRAFDYDILTVDRMRYLINSKTALVAAAVSNSTPVGYMILLTRKNSRVLRIYSLAILPEVRRLGFAGELLNYAEKQGAGRGLETVHLEVHANNRAALIFYLSAGYSLYGRRDRYYTDGSQALLLRKMISHTGTS